MSGDMELRFIDGSKIEGHSVVEAEKREGEDDKGKKYKVSGLAAPFNQRSEWLGWFYERISPGAFSRTLRENQDILALADHSHEKVLGRTTAGTLSLTESSRGLEFDLDMVDTNLGRDTYTLVQSGHITGVSVGFVAREAEWSLEDGEDIRTIHDVDLIEISIVTWPAYTQTEVFKRSKRHKVSVDEVWEERKKIEEKTRGMDADTMRMHLATLQRRMKI